MSNLWNIDQSKTIITFLSESDNYFKKFYAYFYIVINYINMKKYIIYIILIICVIGSMYSCIPVRHFVITKRTQKWEKEHFDPDRPVSRKRKHLQRNQ